MNQPDPLNLLRDLEHQLTVVRAQLYANTTPSEATLALTEELNEANATIAELSAELAATQQQVECFKQEEAARLGTLRSQIEGQLQIIHHELRRSSLQSLERVAYVLDCIDAAQQGEAFPPAPGTPLRLEQEPPLTRQYQLESLPTLSLPIVHEEVGLPAVLPSAEILPLVVEAPELPVAAEPVQVPAVAESIPVPSITTPPQSQVQSASTESVHTAPLTPVASQVLDGVQADAKKKKSARPNFFAIAGLAVMAGGFAFLWNFYGKPIEDTGTVAGVQTTKTQTTTSQYPNAEQGQLPFEQTEWDKISDPTFGITKLDFAKNTSDLVRSGGSNNIFFVSKGMDGLVGHIFKISRFDPEGDASAWIERMKVDLRNEYTFEAGKLNGVDAIVGSAKEQNASSGTMYLITANSSGSGAPQTLVYQVWAKQIPSRDPNAARVARMLSSLKLGD